jgi:hypothetical protein
LNDVDNPLEAPVQMKFANYILLSFMCLAPTLSSCAEKQKPTRFNADAIRTNPNPIQVKRLSAQLTGIDASTVSFTADALYRVQNRACVAVDPHAAIGGLQLLPEHSLALPVSLVRNGEVEFSFALDALQPDDYFGKGVCLWALDGVTLRFTNGTTKFVSGLSLEQVNAGKPVDNYFLKKDAEAKPEVMDVVFGEAENFYAASAGPQFRLTFIVK